MSVDGASVLIVSARYYDDIADELLKGATAALQAAGASWTVIEAPGALEIAPILAMACQSGRFGRWTADARFQGAVALGCVIRGETTHYDIVANESARALMDLSCRYFVPVGNGVLTVENYEQAWERASVTGQNKGGGAALACLAVIRAAQAIRAL